MSALVVLAGQSEMITFGLTPASLPAYALTPDPHVQILVGSAFQTMVPGVNTGGPNTPNAWGPVVSYAHDWTAAHPGETLYLVLSAKGSTGLTAGAAPNWSPEQPAAPDGSPNGMFNKTTVLVDEAKALTGLPVSAVLWSEGETPATDATQAATFGAQTADLFAHMRSEWGADRIVFSEISDQPGFAYGDPVRAAQLAIAAADPHALLIDTDALPLQADNLHFAAAGALALGDAFYVGDELGELLTAVGARFMGEIVAGAL
jgi:hypothetical protein